MSKKPRLGLALCGSYCTYEMLFAAAERVKTSPQRKTQEISRW